MCRTLRGGRAEAMTTLTPIDGRHRSAPTVRSLTCLESVSSVPSRSTATRATLGRVFTRSDFMRGSRFFERGPLHRRSAIHDDSGKQEHKADGLDRSTGNLLDGAT